MVVYNGLGQMLFRVCNLYVWYGWKLGFIGIACIVPSRFGVGYWTEIV